MNFRPYLTRYHTWIFTNQINFLVWNIFRWRKWNPRGISGEVKYKKYVTFNAIGSINQIKSGKKPKTHLSLIVEFFFTLYDVTFIMPFLSPTRREYERRYWVFYYYTSQLRLMRQFDSVMTIPYSKRTNSSFLFQSPWIWFNNMIWINLKFRFIPISCEN